MNWLKKLYCNLTQHQVEVTYEPDLDSFAIYCTRCHGAGRIAAEKYREWHRERVIKSEFGCVDASESERFMSNQLN